MRGGGREDEALGRVRVAVVRAGIKERLLVRDVPVCAALCRPPTERVDAVWRACSAAWSEFRLWCLVMSSCWPSPTGLNKEDGDIVFEYNGLACCEGVKASWLLSECMPRGTRLCSGVLGLGRVGGRVRRGTLALGMVGSFKAAWSPARPSDLERLDMAAREWDRFRSMVWRPLSYPGEGSWWLSFSCCGSGDSFPR